MQTENRVLDELAKIVLTAAGAAQGAAREAETLMRGRLERLASDLDLVSREEFEAMADLARAARSKSDALERRVAALEAKLARESAKAGRVLRRRLRPQGRPRPRKG